jgi:Flp pilus assembly protein TadD
MSASTESHFNSRLGRTAIFADRIVAVLLFAAVVCFAVHKIVAYDVWWQLKTGEWVLDHGFPSTDPFSYATPDRPWIEMRWLYCVAANLIFKGFGLNALIIAETVLVSLAFGCLWVVDRKAPVWGRCLGVACALAVAHLRFTIRPELVTFLLLSVTLLGLHRYKSGARTRWIYALPVMQVLWTNSHTVFILGPVTIWIFALAELAAGWTPFRSLRASAMSRERLRPLLVVAALSTVACVASPYSIRGALFPLQLFSQIQAGNVIRELITELQSPFSYSGSIFFIRYPIVAVISALTFLLNWKRPSPGAIGLWCAYLYLSTQSERNLSLFGLVAGFCVIVNCSEAARDKHPGRVRTFAAWSTRAVCAALALVAIPAVVTDFYYQKIDPSRRFGFGVAKYRFPIRAMAFIDAERLPGPILSNLVDSNFVLFDRGSKSIYVDGRLEVYGGEIFKRADDLFRTGNGFDEAVASHGIGTVLVAYGTDGNMFRAVMRKADWAPLYFDETHVVFVRVTPETGALVDALRIDWREPVRREVVVAARLNPPDWLAGTWPKVADDIAPKALGQLALLTGNLRLARARFEEALRARPDDAYAALHLVVICRALGDDACANTLVALGGAEAAQITTPMAAAAAFEGSGSLEAAVATYGEMIARNRATTDVYQKLAQAASGANMLDEAEKAYRELADQQPNAAQYWNGLGMVATRRGAYEAALNYFKRSLAIAPRQPAALTAVGVVYGKMGQLDRARESFKQALAIDPNYQPARQQLGSL